MASALQIPDDDGLPLSIMLPYGCDLSGSMPVVANAAALSNLGWDSRCQRPNASGSYAAACLVFSEMEVWLCQMQCQQQ